jgi:hypothetical protein
MKNKLIIAVMISTALYISCSYSQEYLLAGLKYHNEFKSNGNSVLNPANNIRTKDMFSMIKNDIGDLSKIDVRNYKKTFLLRTDSIPASNNISQNSQKEKSVWIGIGLSALIPGAGEFYAKNYLKAAIFFGIELACWGTYYYFQHTGNVKTNDFQSYANQHWDVRYYAQWLINGGFHSSGQINPNESNLEVLRQEIVQCESDPQNPFSHTLPEYGTQQFYELIGKYQEFEPGWTNLQHALDYSSASQYYWQTYRDPVFVNYSISRQEANNFYNRGTTMSMIIIANHILSAADAAWSVAMFNKNLRIQTGFRIGTYLTPYTYEEKTLPTFNLRVSF